MSINMVERVLAKSNISYVNYNESSKVFITRNNQLISTHSELLNFKKKSPPYKGWHSHHIIEDQDLRHFGISKNMPIYKYQMCVLLPSQGHSNRINSVLNRNQLKNFITNINKKSDIVYILQTYSEAYWLLDNYCGGGKDQIQNELVKIVETLIFSRNILKSWI